jgi:hypothetical protein
MDKNACHIHAGGMINRKSTPYSTIPPLLLTHTLPNHTPLIRHLIPRDPPHQPHHLLNPLLPHIHAPAPIQLAKRMILLRPRIPIIILLIVLLRNPGLLLVHVNLYARTKKNNTIPLRDISIEPNLKLQNLRARTRARLPPTRQILITHPMGKVLEVVHHNRHIRMWNLLLHNLPVGLLDVVRAIHDVSGDVLGGDAVVELAGAELLGYLGTVEVGRNADELLAGAGVARGGFDFFGVAEHGPAVVGERGEGGGGNGEALGGRVA